MEAAACFSGLSRRSVSSIGSLTCREPVATQQDTGISEPTLPAEKAELDGRAGRRPRSRWKKIDGKKSRRFQATGRRLVPSPTRRTSEVDAGKASAQNYSSRFLRLRETGFAWGLDGLAAHAHHADTPTPHADMQTLPDSLQRLTNWFQELGGSITGTEFGTRNGLRGLFAARDVEPGERLIVLPSAAQLSVSSAGALAAGTLDPRLPPVVVLAAQIAQIRRSGGAWAAYVDALPSNYPGQACFLTGADMATLDKSSITALTIQGMRQAANEATGLLPKTRAFDNADFTWAYAGVMTRSLDINGDLKMLPMVDMLNHSADANAQITLDQDAIVVVAARAIAAGEELTVRYRSVNNNVLMAVYGFCGDDVPADEKIFYPVPGSASPLVVSPQYADAGMRALLAHLRAQAPGGQGTGASAQRPINRANELAAWTALNDTVALALASRTVSLQQWDALLASGILTVPQRMLVSSQR
ncbi:MAG: SET domain-containing protein-lysine N-methyltransferase, partial [Burkholderiaceae bacterium]